ncbi:ABC transporter substrate-binding protein [Collimonas sp. OK242]|uniref:ABC transporter substrate-binding protein n=1 Tax=Collimonas sp. OK242 TaxID=1798195 RepID=UPI002101B06F|nr:ABC transporter substrate binding protein [Collimonas sp. OK242]
MLIQPASMSCAATLRIQVGLFLLLICVFSHAGQEISYQDLGKRTSAGDSHWSDWRENSAEIRIARHELKPMIMAVLAALDAPRRQEILDGKGAIAVIYPDIGEPYRSIFAKIIEGIQEQAKVQISTYPVGPNTNTADLNAQLTRGGVKVVIALGRQGLKAASGLERDIAVVVGGVLAVPESESHNLTGISLTPDPALLFALLKRLLPGIKRVTVVYDPQHNDWLIKLAREAAKAQGLELVAREAHDLASAAHLYEAAFAAADGRQDAIWLPQDATTVDEDTILPLVLRESWSRGVPVFSSSFLHVRKGAMFALYPNNLGLGRDLASSALATLAGESRKRGVSPLREVLTAVNLRTASHIGLNLDYQQQRSFDFVFPEP